jgi:hypothetical protein
VSDWRSGSRVTGFPLEMSPERVSRKDDERLYQPRIHSRHIRRLHELSEVTGTPMTVLVDSILREGIEQRGTVPVHSESGEHSEG